VPRKRKRRGIPLTELPPEKLLRRIFPKKPVEKAKQVAHEKDDPEDDSQVSQVVLGGLSHASGL